MNTFQPINHRTPPTRGAVARVRAVAMGMSRSFAYARSLTGLAFSRKPDPGAGSA